MGLVNLRYLKHGHELELSGNRLEIIRPGSFQAGVAAEAVALHSQVSVIERNAFDDLKNLEELNLSHNSLHSLPTTCSRRCTSWSAFTSTTTPGCATATCCG
ncbi:unnamed protein product [Gadus morhua 'NCC']